MDDTCLWLFPSFTNGVQGVLTPDGGATANYVDRKYLMEAGVSYKKFPVEKEVGVAGGYKIKVYGTCDLPLNISGWRETVQAYVLDLSSEFDIVLGLGWQKRRKIRTDWDTMRIELMDNGKVYWLVPYPCPLGKIQGEPEWMLNTITHRGAQKALRCKGTEAMLYFVRNPESEEDSSEPEEGSALDSTTNAMLDAQKDPNLKALLTEFADVFKDKLPEKLPPERGLVHEIDTGDNAPINTQAYQLSQWQIDEQTKQIADLMSKGLVRESSSAWGSPVLFVRKPDQTWRMCIDYRAVNRRTKKNTYPLPRIQDCIDQLGWARFLSIIDLTSGYWQVRIKESDVEKTAFNTRHGKYEFLVMPFGLTNAPATFQTLVNKVFRRFLNDFLIVYLDDIVIYSNSYDEHLEHLRRVFQVLRENQLYAKPHKCVFNKPEIQFCGHIVGNGKIKVVQDKIKAIREWPRPKNVHDVRQFLGLASYYRRFIRNFSQIALPLTNLLRIGKMRDKQRTAFKFKTIVWNTAHQLAFERLKQKLTRAPVLMQIDPSKSFTVETDASDFAIGACLLQISGDDGKLHPVAFCSRKLNGAELNYPVHEKELLSVKEALRVWEHYLDNGREITILTDHESLKYLETIKRPSKRLVRWIEEFQGWNLKIKYRKGSEAVVPDALSRRPDYRRLRLNVMRGLAPNEEYVMYMEDYLKMESVPESGKEFEELIKLEARHFAFDEEGRLVRRVAPGVVAPYIEWEFRGDLVQRLHDEYGHLSAEGMKNLIETRGWWPKMDKDIHEFRASCANCQTAQRQRKGQEREYTRLPTPRFIQPFQRWGIDLIGILPKTKQGNRWILTAIDYATGWPIAKALPEATEDAIADFIFHEIYMHYGAPQEIFTDGGKNFWGNVVQKYLNKIKTVHRSASPYHPRTNGKVESLNGLLGNMLTKYLLGKPTRLWDQYLDQALFACRVRTHSTTHTSPFYLVYGNHPRLVGDDNHPLDVDVPPREYRSRLENVQSARQEANRNTYETALQQKQRRDDLVQPHKLEVGDWVLVRHENPKKFESKWFGPYQIVEKMMLGTYRLQGPTGKTMGSLVHGNRLIKAHTSSAEKLRKLWASPSIKDKLRRRNVQTEFVPSNDKNTQILEQYLYDDDDPAELQYAPRQQDPPRSPVAEATTAPVAVIPSSEPQLANEPTNQPSEQPTYPKRIRLRLRPLEQQRVDAIVENEPPRKRRKHYPLL
jgi:hypothetical protein